MYGQGPIFGVTGSPCVRMDGGSFGGAFGPWAQGDPDGGSDLWIGSVTGRTLFTLALPGLVHFFF